MIDSIGGRKVAVALVVLALALGTTYFKGDVPPGLLALLQTVFAAFVIGNAFGHAAGAYIEGKASGASQPPPPPETIDMTPILEKLHETQESVSTIQNGLVTLFKRVFPNG